VAIFATAIFVDWMVENMNSKVTALKAQKRNPRRVNVYLDGRYAFSLTAIQAARLKVGQTLSHADIDALQEHDTAEEAYERVLHFLSYRPRSEAEVRQYLHQRGLPDEISDQVINRLRRVGLLDDLAFARYWVENRERLRPRSPWALRQELQAKGLASEIIETALAEVDPEESAYRVALRQAQRLSPCDWETFRRKVGPYLQRRGFAFDTINLALQRAWQECMPDQESQ